METVTNKIDERIAKLGDGAVFASREFLEFGSRAAVDQALTRLTRQGRIRRLARGMYDVSRYSEFLGTQISPTPDAIADALAKKTEERLQMTGAKAANVLGLSEQVPARVVFLTDGRSRRLKVGGQEIELRHTAARYMALESRTSAMVIQALRHLGRVHVDDKVVHKLRATLSKRDREALWRDATHAPGWMRTIIAQITDREGGDE